MMTEFHMICWDSGCLALVCGAPVDPWYLMTGLTLSTVECSIQIEQVLKYNYTAQITGNCTKKTVAFV